MFHVLDYDLRLRHKLTRFLIAFLVYLIGGFPTLVYALPKGGVISSGAGSIESSGSSLTVTQTTDKIVINWESFSVGNNESVIFLQPGSNSSALNNILSNSRTVVEGNLSANGQIVLSNPNGIYISPTANINVASLIASTLKISEQDFIDGLYKFSSDPSRPLAAILNEGKIHASEFAALIAPSVSNKGVVVANLGTVGIAAGEAVTVDFVGNELISFAIDKPVEGQVLDKDGNLINDRISNSGAIQAKGGQAILTAKNASDIIKNVINMEGMIEANTVVKKDGRIFLGGGDEGKVNVAGSLKASGEESGDSGGEIFIQGASVILDKSLIQAKGKDAKGGNITITGENWLSIGGQIDASGNSGGNIKLTAGSLSIAAPILAQGTTGQGGNLNINALSRSWENVDALLDVTGAGGGSIQHFTGHEIQTSGKYLALGNDGKGGSIDVTASSLNFMSNTIDASGTMGGGTIRLGGEYQGGKNLAVDEMQNAQTLLMTDAAQITAKATSTDGSGGRVIVWADQQAAVFGQLDVSPGTQTGAGGFVEVSSADTLTFGAKVLTGFNDRRGELLLDPKNITITSSGVESGAFSLAAMMGHGYSGGKNFNQSLDASDNFGSALSLDGNRLAVGSAGWSSAGDGNNNGRTNSGEVYLYSFTDSSFSGASLEAMIGDGYTGGKNINQSLGNSDTFGTGVSLDGNRLVVGAWTGDGLNNGRTNSGEVYLYTFSDSAFSGGSLAGMIGHGYTGGKNINQTLDTDDRFGYSVSLDGNRLAVGAYYGDGFNNQVGGSGDVRLYTFTDSVFSGGELAATIGDGYTGGKNFDQELSTFDVFSSVSLDGNRLVVGARWANGYNDTNQNSGDVYLFTFSDNAFSNPTLAGMIGHGYTGGKNINLQLATGYVNNGVSVSLDGNMLATGCFGCRGKDNKRDNSGQVFIFTFEDSVFSDGELDATIGYGFTGGKNVNQDIPASDVYGWNVALDNNRLAVGAMWGDGNNDGLRDSGDVYLYTAAPAGDAVSSAVFATNAASNSTITPDTITTLLSAGTNVVMQANNDITVSEAITANNSGGDGGDLTLQAGRSILVNANITTDNGDLSLIANDHADNPDGSHGVVDAQRDSGTAVITLASGTTMNTGTGAFTAEIKAGTGKTNRTSGDMTLSSITAGSLVASNSGPTSGSDIVDNGALTISGTSSFTTSVSNADIAIDSTTNAFTGAVSINTNGSTGHAVIDGGTTALNIGQSTIGGALLLTTGNSITDSGIVTVGADLSVNTDANNGSINLGTLAIDGALQLITHGSGSATVVNDAGLHFVGSTIGGELWATATTGNIRDTQNYNDTYRDQTLRTALTAGGNSSFTTSASNATITLDDPTNALSGIVRLSTRGAAGNATIDNGTTALIIGSTSVGGNLTLTSGNASGITDNLRRPVTVGGNLSVTTDANNGVINLDTLAVDGSVFLKTHGTGNATVENETSLKLAGGSFIGGNLIANAKTGKVTTLGKVTVIGTSNLPNDEVLIKREKMLKQMTVLVAIPMAPRPTAGPSFSGRQPGGGVALPVPGPRSTATPSQSAPLIGFSSKAAAPTATPVASPSVKPAGGSSSAQPVRASSAKPGGGSGGKSEGGGSGGKAEGGGSGESSEGGSGESSEGGSGESSEGGSGESSEGGSGDESSEDDEEKEE